MKRIALHGKHGKGKFALVDDEDYELVSRFKWHLSAVGGSLTHGYFDPDRQRWTNVLLHRLIMQPGPGDQVDHKNRNRLDNRRSNLRICTPSQNMLNKPKSGFASSKYKGVYWDASKRRWRARIRYKNVSKSLGIFRSEAEAARAYNLGALEVAGEFAVLNVIE